MRYVMWSFFSPKTENEIEDKADMWKFKTTSIQSKKKLKDFILVYDVNKPSMLFVSTLVNMGTLGLGIDYNDIIRMENPDHAHRDGIYIIMNPDGSFKDTERYKWTVTEDYPWLTEWKNQNAPAEVKAEPDK